MNLTPFVSPANGEVGVELAPIITATFDFALEPGSIKKDNFLLIKKTANQNNNLVEPVPVSLSHVRLELNSDQVYTGKDYGDSSEAGELYRTKVLIDPTVLLSSHSEYSVLISKDVSALSVFDLRSTPSVVSKYPVITGEYEGLTEDTYEILITETGSHSQCKYSWTRLSDSYSESNLSGSRRSIEIDRGILIKFQEGGYHAGDLYTFKVRPTQKINQTFSWDFSTGDGAVVEPEDSNSGSVIDLPVYDQEDTSSGTGDFKLIDISPYDGATFFERGQYASCVISGVVFKSIEKLSELNNKRIKIINNTSLNVYELNEEIFIEIETGVTTHQDIVDLIEASTFPFRASTSTPGSIVSAHESGVVFQNGENAESVVFTFNKNLSAVSSEAIKVVFESLDSLSKGALDFKHEIQDNKLIIKFE